MKLAILESCKEACDLSRDGEKFESYLEEPKSKVLRGKALHEIPSQSHGRRKSMTPLETWRICILNHLGRYSR